MSPDNSVYPRKLPKEDNPRFATLSRSMWSMRNASNPSPRIEMADDWLGRMRLFSSIVNAVTRVKLFPDFTFTMSAPLGTPSASPERIVVTPIPAPWRVMPLVLGMVTWVVQLHLPAGMSTRSPFTAELIAVCTAVFEHDFAIMSAARAVVAKQTKMTEQRSTSTRFILSPLVGSIDPPSVSPYKRWWVVKTHDSSLTTPL